MEEDDDHFGLSRPTIITTLRSILYQYDSGQILKEILQNAEDAGARTVKFLFDENSYGKDVSQLYHPGLAEFQGPALYAYNDGQFEEKDWEGIGKLQESVKEKEPLKVGRFGLGFKSVFHLTDLPCILSGDRLALIDPHERYFTSGGRSSTGYCWRLPQRRAILERIPQQYAAFCGLFGCTESTLLEGQFKGTIFRFPLRHLSSELSDNVYTKDKIFSLFSSFEAEAPLVLLFLKCVETIEVLHRKPGQQDPEVLFSVSLNESCRQAARKARSDFMAAIDPSHWLDSPIHTVYNLNVTHIHSADDSTDTNSYQYLVVEYYAGGPASETMRMLHQNKGLSHVPLVGAAMSIGSSSRPPDVSDESRESSKPSGQVFCFLPLRTDQRSNTGLPVHVNGYFSVSQNRHSLNLPSAGQDIENDPGMSWNNCLLTEVIPVAYRTLIQEAVVCVEHNLYEMTAYDVYAALPNMEEVHEQWQVILKPFLQELLIKEAIFYSPGPQAAAAKWVDSSKAIFDCMDERPSLQQATVSLLREGGVHVVDCPKYLLHAFGTFGMKSPQTVTPNLLRQVLRQQPSLLAALQSEHKLMLLEYVLKDEEFHDLLNIPLLPLASGQFIQFCQPGGVDEVFLVKDESERALLSRLPGQLLLSGLSETVSGKLKKLADAGLTQVKILSPSDVTKHLPKMIPNNWFQMDVTHLHHEEDEAVLSWLETVWNYLRQHYPSNLSSVTGLPILAVHSDDHTAIHILSSPSKVALQSAKGYTISEGVQEGLCCLGVELVSELHHAVANHAAVLGNYVHVPQAEDLLKAALVAHKTGKQSLETFGVNASSTSRSELCELWSKLVPGELSAEDRAYLTDLPLFRVWGKSDDPVVYVNAATVRFAAPLEVPPVPAPTRMLNLKDEAPRMLAKLLSITPMKLSQYFSQHVFPNLHLFHEDKEAMMKTMDFMMDRLPLLQQENARFMDDLTNLKFVPNLGGGYKVPSELFDPEDELVKYFFIGDDAFPGGRYQQPEILVILRKLGLQGAAQIQARHVLFAIKSLQQHAAASDDMKMCLEKAKAIFQHLSNHPHQLREVVDGQPLSAWISNMAWVPTQQHPPSIYSNNMPWFESPLFEVPRNIFSPEWSALIGSVAPVMLSEPSKTLAETFTWQNPPPLGVVLKQLKVLIQNYVSTDKAQLLTLISSIYGRLSSESGLHLQESLIDVGLSSWIWNGDGFSEPESIVVKKYQLDLTPYCFTLPSEIAMYQDLFVNCGASHEVTDEVLVLVLTSMKNKYSLKTEKSPDTDRLKNEKENCARDLQMSVDVLNILKSHHLSPELLGRVFIPVETELEGICFLPVDACTYCDIEWLQQGFSLQSFDEKDGIHLIHPNLPVATAEALRVPTLMSRMLLAEEFDAWGQQESLTDRLHQLLEEYSDGFAIFKELIQNADDAGATTVKILYDERQNEEFTTYLLDKGMKHCQGPALWVYNDAMFTDQDFKNITQLGGATKEAQLDKIGRFGLGFNAVYNITDVPSFISRNCLVIFDPHLTHLGTARRDRTSPGIRIDLQKSGHRTLIRKLPDQFEPYRKVFGCEIGYEAENHFNGTLFRFPLRDRQQSQKSKISCRHYDHQEITDLLTFLVQGAPNLLMFTQNVKNVEVFHLSPGKKNPENASEILSIHKDLVNTLNVIGNTEFNNSLNPLSRMLSIGAKYIDDVKDKRQDFDKSQIPSATCVVRMTVNVTDNGESLTSQKAYTSEQLWLISTTVGQKQSLSLGLEKNNLIPVASVAAPLCYESDVLKPVPVESIGQKGHLFCFLPLPIESGLPVHVNGAFAVQSNRRYLAEQTEDDKFCVKAEWNRALVQDAVMYAYEKLLVSMCQLPQNGTTLFTDLWPNSKNALPIMSPLIQEFYGRLSGESQSIPVCFDGKEHVPISDAIFLDPVLRDNPEVGDKAMSIFQQYSPGSVAFDLSSTIRQSFVAAKQHIYINKKTYSEVDFFSKVFFKQIADIDSETRDALVWYILNQPNLTNLAMTLPCILVDCKGNSASVFKVPSELFDPDDELVKRFFLGDDVFPGGRYQQPEILVILRKLGLKGAAQIQARHVLLVIQSLQQHAAASDDMKMCLEKAKAIFQHLSNHPHQLREVVDGQPLSAWISNMAWVPTQQHPPSIYPNNMPWFESPLFEVPRNVFSPEWSALIGSVAPVMLSEPSKTLAETFTWQNPPPLGVVLKQLKVLIQNYVSTDKAQLLTLISSIYGRLSSESGLHLQESLIDVGLSSWIWNGDGFSEPESIVVKKYQLDLTPYCFTLPSEIAMYQDLFVNCGASHEVTDEVLVLVLTSMKNKYSLKTEKSPDTDRLKNEKENCARDLQMSVDVLNILKSHHLSPELLGRVFIPVETELEGICFLPVDACTYCDIEWLQQGFSLQSFDEKDGIHLIHPNLPVATAEALRVPTLMSRMLLAEEFDAWGQQESLTDRLHQLLEEYSDGFAIFKELIQNADDAGATTVKILYDERQNEEFTTYLLDKGMKHCQGPALWVYNDAMFTDQDFKNITQLGGATKEAQLDKIGRFGLGFNAVYNITDVPSFISRNCLVIFDPHLTHLGTARRDRTSPGIRIDLQKSGHRTLIRKLPDQFEPYRKVFGCEIGYEAENHFNGTLFRFPLRDRQQSQKSKISCRHYDHQEITDLLTFLVQGAPNLLMFTQNVKNVEVFHLSPGKKNPENASEILSIHKDLVNTLNVIGNTEFNNSLNPLSRMLSIGAKYIDDVKDKRQDFDKSQIPSATCVVRMTVNVTDNGESLTSQKAYTSEQLWLISTTVGQKQSLSLGLEKNNLIPVASVAAPLCYESDVLKPVPMESIGQKGHLFCFLPLPIESGLPVHVNGAFAVQSNRRYLAEQTEDDKFCVKAEWNRALVQDAVMYAYEKLLVSMCQLPQNGTTLFTDLWPNSKNALPIMSPLIQEFYGRLSGESQSIPVCFDGKEHVPISDAIFLDPVLRDNPEVGDKAMSIFQQYSPGSVAFDLSSTIRQSFVAAKQHIYINKKTYSEVDFFSKVFFKQIADIDSETRDALVWYILNQPNLTNLAMTLPCILVDCKGNSASVFKVPSELFDPDDELVKRFFLGDDVFPGGRYQQPEILVILRKLGLKGAAQIQARHVLLVIQSLQQHAAASDDMKMCLEKAKAIFQHLSNHPHQLREVVDGQPLSAWISNMAWVPTQQHPPSIYPNNMPWFESPLFEVPRNVFSPEWSALIGSVAPVMLSEPSKTLAETFTWQNPPPLGVVLKQLKVLIQNYVSTDKAQLLTLISSIYGRLSSEGALHLQESLITAGLTQWIWNGEGFSELQSIVVKRYQLDLSPYCYTLPSEIAMYQDFFVRCGASYEVTDEVLVLVLTAMKNKYTMENDHLAEVDKLKSMEGHYTQDLQLSVAQDLQLSVAQDLQLSVNVLNILKSHVTTISPALLGNLLVPVETKVGSFCLLPIVDCTYYDIKWLQQGFSPQSWDEDDGINFIHPNLPMATAQALGVPTLMSRMLDADELEVTAWGQQESLTDRLHQLLEEYSDGFAIFKELIQNADDAGATTVKILYDERQNEEFTTYLLDEGMKHCQGPALWVYNDAVFTDQDLKNITKLGAATKEAQLDKIGRFGLGFNAVYNITDVPSFISRNYLVIFDPHLTHLGTARRDQTSPGILIDIQKSGHQTLIRKLPDQFEPYRKVFGCEIGCQTENHFNGTLFRFPLRDREQSRKSKICCHHYDHKDMTDLLRFLVQGAPNLLLFTQNVKNVEVFHLPSCEKDPENATEILSIHRDLVNTGITEFSDPLNFLSRMLSVGAKYMDDLKDKRQDFDKSQTPSATCVLRMTVNVTDNGESLTSQKSGSSEQLWLISTTVGQKQSLSLGLKKDNLIPVASVAAPLCYKGGVLKPVPVESIGQKGHLFCFLPLPIESGLPVHVNGAFAVQSNRRYLCEQTEDDKFCAKAKWNEALLKDPVIFAYEKLLLGMCQLPQCGITLFTELWPNLKDASPAMSPLIKEFYARLSEESQPIPVCFDGKKSVPISETIFLDPVLRDNPEVGDKAMSIFEHYSPDCPFAFDLPNTIRQSFVAAKQQHYIDKKTYTEVDFFTKVFFKEITGIDAEPRDALMCYILDKQDNDLTVIAMTSPCIPVSPEGKKLKYPNETIHPRGSAAKLYAPEDERFPYGETYCTVERLLVLEKLGMQSSDLHWRDIYERAESIAKLKENSMVKRRQGLLLDFLDEKLKKLSDGNGKQSCKAEQCGTDIESAGENLQKIPFLSPLKKPEAFPLPWHAELLDEDTLLAAENMYPKDCQFLLSCSQYIVNENKMTPRVEKLLGLANKEFRTEFVLTQFKHALQADPRSLGFTSSKTLDHLCFAVYGYLQQKCEQDPQLGEYLRNTYQDIPCILLGRKYVKPSEAAFISYANFDPYLHHIATEDFHPIYSILGVREKFQIMDFMATLQKMQTENDGKPLNSGHLEISLSLVRELDACMTENEKNVEHVCQQYGKIYIPDSHGILQDSSTLCYNDSPWLPDSKEATFTHPGVTLATSRRLGVKTSRQEALSEHAQGIPFGQKEDLLCSLKRILKNYPMDHGILKEFIQNADDAGAKEVHFVLDERTHPSDFIFADTWKPLQGPALCIYNDKSFSMADLEGIQRLGSGNKSYDPNRTGEYGIGFCSAYHLTDAPSLLSRGGELGETLCVFDPMCKYVPGATSAEPGMRYTNLENVRTSFPDVFSGYLEDTLNGNSCTVFRLPLRSKDMAEASTISHTPMTLWEIKKMLMELQCEALDILLFTNNLKQLHFSQISSDDGRLQGTYSVKSALQPSDAKKRSEFVSYVQQCGHQLKERPVRVEEIVLKDVMYDVTLSDNSEVKELWRVCQRIGTAPDQKVPTASKEAFCNGELCLLPRGGTACLIKRETHGQIYQNKRKRKVFSSLPLPQETGLPMHINGHFAFDFENRQHLWRSKNDDYRQAWNNFLFSDLIAPCYLELMKSMRLQSLHVRFEDDITIVTCGRERLQAAIKEHQKLFPVFNPAHPDFEVLVKAILFQSAELDIPILPCIFEEQGYAKQSVSLPCKKQGAAIPRYRVIWRPPCGKGNKKSFFCIEDDFKQPKHSVLSHQFCSPTVAQKPVEKSDHEILKDVLKACGFNIIEGGSEIQKSYKDAGVDIHYMSPDEVNLFFQSCTSGECMGHVGKLPCELEGTPFGKTAVLKIVIDFCKRDPLFPKKLDGLPLCFTGDNQLEVFHASDPKFPAAHQNLVKQCAGQFLHHEVSKQLLKDIDIENTPVLRMFDIAAFASILHKTLKKAVYYKNGGPVEWKKSSGCFPDEKWITNVWKFLRKEVYCKLGVTKTRAVVGSTDHEINTDSKLNKDDLKEALAPLSHWCILPATCKYVPKLYSISNSEQVLDLRWSNSHNKWPIITTEAVKFLTSIGVPVICTSSLDRDITSAKISDFVKNMITNMDNPVGVLMAALLSCKTNKDKISQLNLSEGWGLLHYFSKHIRTIQKESDALQMLRQLPLYQTVTGHVIPLTECVAVYTLPANIPVEDMDVWHNKCGTVFLAYDEGQQPLYSALNCASVTHMEAYCKFILQHFELISYNAQLIHLHHLYETYLEPGFGIQSCHIPVSEGEKNNLLDCMRKLCFLKDQDGNMSPASDFFDPEVELFRVMKSQHELPPMPEWPFDEVAWLSLLRMMGLQRDVSSEMCKKFASQIAHLGKGSGNESTRKKSEAMIGHLFKMKDAGSRDKILMDVAHVPFVQPEKASPALRHVYHQHGDQGDGKLPYVCFKNGFSMDDEKLVWTFASLLPSWADPSKQLSQQDVACVQKCLGMHARPPLELVVQHLHTLCSHIMANLECLPDFDVLSHLFKPVYLYLQEHMADNPELLQGLDDLPCVLVQGRMPFIKAHFTVLNMGRGEEISEYLLRVPAELGECHTLFLKLGAQDHVTVDQFASVLECLHDKVPSDVLLPNELRVAYKAIKGLAETLLKEKTPVQSKSLYLPDEKGQLRDVSQLVFNDAPAYYDRVQGFDFHFLFDTLECGIEYRRFEQVFHLLPSTLQPSYMSEHVKETLVKSSRDSATVSGLAALMDERLHSELFQKAVTRLARHEAYKSGQQLQDDTLAHALDQLSVVKLKVWSVERLQTVLKCKGKKISESQSDKSCFVEKEGTAGNIESWNIYLHQAASLSQDIQILLAGAVNTILGGLLRDSALFLQPLLVCPEADIEARLDAMNIRLDDSSCRACVRTLPTLGEPVSNVHRQWICASPGGDFQQGEFVAFKESSEADFVYAVVEEDVTSTGNNPTAQFCRISLGPQCPPESKALNTLHKIERGS